MKASCMVNLWLHHFQSLLVEVFLSETSNLFFQVENSDKINESPRYCSSMSHKVWFIQYDHTFDSSDFSCNLQLTFSIICVSKISWWSFESNFWELSLIKDRLGASSGRRRQYFFEVDWKRNRFLVIQTETWLFPHGPCDTKKFKELSVIFKAF